MVAKLSDGEGHQRDLTTTYSAPLPRHFALAETGGSGPSPMWRDIVDKWLEESRLRQEAAMAQYYGLSTVSLDTTHPELQHLCEELRAQVEQEFQANAKNAETLQRNLADARKKDELARMTRQAVRLAEVARLDRQGVPDTRWFASALANGHGGAHSQMTSGRPFSVQGKRTDLGLSLASASLAENGDVLARKIQELSQQWALNGGSGHGFDTVVACLSQGKQLFFGNRQLQAAYNNALKAANA